MQINNLHLTSKEFVTDGMDETRMKQMIGPYALQHLVATKNYSKTYLALDTRCKTLTRLKFIYLDKCTKEEIKKYLAEAQNMSALDHPNIPQLYHITHVQNIKLLTISHCGKLTLHNFVRERGLLKDSDAHIIFMQLVSAVIYLHSNCIAHQNITPNTIIMGSEGQPQITGFSNSSVIEWSSDHINATSCSQHGQELPTNDNTKFIGAEGDVFALGIVLCFMLTGKLLSTNNAVEEFKELASVSYIGAKDLILNMITADKSSRLSIDKVREHHWMNSGHHKPISGGLPKRPNIVQNPHYPTLEKMPGCGYTIEQTKDALSQKQPVPKRIVCIYHLLLEGRRSYKFKPADKFVKHMKDDVREFEQLETVHASHSKFKALF